MSRYDKPPIDFTDLKTVGLHERGGKVKTADFASVYRQGSGIAGWLDSLPRILAGDSFRAVVDAASRGARRRARHHLGPGRPRDQVRPGAGADRPDEPGLRHGFRAERLRRHPRFRNRAGRAHQRGCGGRAARRPLRLGRGDRPRNEPRHCGRRPRRARHGRIAGPLAGTARHAQARLRPACCCRPIATGRR